VLAAARVLSDMAARLQLFALLALILLAVFA
jgi:hypothetical protein